MSPSDVYGLLFRKPNIYSYLVSLKETTAGTYFSTPIAIAI